MPRIEPRQYITIYERKNKKATAEPIWWLTKDYDTLTKDNTDEKRSVFLKPVKFFTRQKHEIVDQQSLLEVRFDQEELAKNIYFYGNISLTARAGNNKIEVTPYSVIGETQKTYGVNSKPILEIADHFLRLRIEAMKANSAKDRLTAAIDRFKVLKQTLSERVKSYNTSMAVITMVYDQLNRTFPNANMSKSLTVWPEFFTKQAVKDAFAILETMPDGTDKNTLQALRNQLQTISFQNFSNLLSGIIGNAAMSPNIIAAAQNLTNELTRYYNELVSLQGQYVFIIDDESYNKLRIAFESVLPYVSPISRAIIELDLNRRLISKGEKNKLPVVFPQPDANTPEYEVPIENEWTAFIEPARRATKFMEYFNLSGDESKDAFLQLIMMTKVDFNEVLRNAQQAITFFDRLATPVDKLNSSIDAQFLVLTRQLIGAISEINRSSPELIKYLREQSYDETFNKINRPVPVVENVPASLPSRSTPAIAVSTAEDPELLKDPDAWDAVRQNVALFAGKILFSRLVYATIDLEKEGVQEGQYVYISVMWYNINNNTRTAEDGIELATAKFYIKDTGWRLAAVESALLITRKDEDFARPQNLSPSQFKPTGGASLLWSYRSDKRYRSDQAFFRTFEKIGKWFEPSIGLNVSYVDFNTTKDFEIGLGPVLGLWDNRIFLTTGYNFSVRGESPFYFGVGLSFYNLFATVRSKVTATTNQ